MLLGMLSWTRSLDCVVLYNSYVGELGYKARYLRLYRMCYDPAPEEAAECVYMILEVLLVMTSPADLFIRKELDSRVGDNPDTVGAIALEHALDALPLVHVLTPLS